MKKKIFGLFLLFLLLIAGDIFAQSSRRYRLNTLRAYGSSADDTVRYIDVTGAGTATMRFVITHIDGQTHTWVFERGVRVPGSGGTAPYGTYHYRWAVADGERITETAVAFVTHAQTVIELRIYEGNYTPNSDMRNIQSAITMALTVM